MAKVLCNYPLSTKKPLFHILPLMLKFSLLPKTSPKLCLFLFLIKIKNKTLLPNFCHYFDIISVYNIDIKEIKEIKKMKIKKQIIALTTIACMGLTAGGVMAAGNGFGQGAGQGAGARSGAATEQSVQWVDNNGDGICDNQGTGMGAGNGQGGNYADSDGDGICDNQGTGMGAGNGQGENFVDNNSDGACDNMGSGTGGGQRRGRK